MDTLQIIITAAGIPSAIVSLGLWMLKRQIEKNEKLRDERQTQQEALQIIILNSVNGTIRLAEATARAIQRIPDARCNGDMHAALDDIQRLKLEQQRLIVQAGVHDIVHN